MARLLEKYRSDIAPKLAKKFALKNINQLPRLEKIVVNMGIGLAKTDSKLLEAGLRDLRQLTGQKAVITRARKSLATFKLRGGMAIGCKVTLRKKRAWEFLDRLINLAIPRIKDFRGMGKKCDGHGNYSMGLQEQLVFPEINPDKVQHQQGMHITMVMANSDDEETVEFLTLLGFPFKRS
ncbi:50S ribosomal protein L5 [Planctomycetota bacterium]